MARTMDHRAHAKDSFAAQTTNARAASGGVLHVPGAFTKRAQRMPKSSKTARTRCASNATPRSWRRRAPHANARADHLPRSGISRMWAPSGSAGRVHRPQPCVSPRLPASHASSAMCESSSHLACFAQAMCECVSECVNCSRVISQEPCVECVSECEAALKPSSSALIFKCQDFIR